MGDINIDNMNSKNQTYCCILFHFISIHFNLFYLSLKEKRFSVKII